MNLPRFTFDPRRPQSEKFSNTDKEDCFTVMVMESIADSDQYREMSERLYRTFKEN